jgi:aminoglycoside-2''-adenylyltransferase
MPLALSADLRRVADVMRTHRGPWGFAGGWAIDLFVGAATRPHADIDVALLRDDQEELRRTLADARIDKVVRGARLPWLADERLESPVHELHATWPDGAHLELVLNDRDVKTDEWVYRRDARVRLPLSRTFHSAGDIPYLAPEIVLLFKSRTPAPKDDVDLQVALPHLDDAQAMWLRNAIVTTGGESRWLELLLRRE